MVVSTPCACVREHHFTNITTSDIRVVGKRYQDIRNEENYLFFHKHWPWVLQIVCFYRPCPHLVMACACHLTAHAQYVLCVTPYNRAQNSLYNSFNWASDNNIQWNPSKMNTSGTKDFVLYREVSFVQGVFVHHAPLTIVANYNGARLWIMKPIVLIRYLLIFSS